MFKSIFWLVVLSTLFFANLADASLINYSKKELADINNISFLNDQIYDGKYQNIMNMVENGELANAKLALAKILTLSPYDITALDISGNILLAEGKYINASKAFERVVKQNKSPLVMAKLGTSFLLLGDIAQGQIWLTQAISLLPKNKLALRYLAWLEAKSNNVNMALHYIEQLAMMEQPLSSFREYHYVYLSLLVEQKKLNQASRFIQTNQKALNNSNDEITIAIKLLEIETLAKLAQLVLAEQKLQQINEKKLTDNELKIFYRIKIFISANQGEFKQSEQLIKNYFNAASDDQDGAYYDLALAYFNKQQFQPSLDILTNLLKKEKITGKRVNYLSDMVAIYVAQSRFSDAIKMLQQQVEIYPESPSYLQQLAEIYLISGRKEAGENTLDQVIKRFPNYVPSYILKGRQLLAKDDFTQTENFYKQATRLKENTPELWIDFAKLYIKAKQIDQAAVVLEQAVSLNNTNPYLVFELATLHDLQEQFDKSEPLYLQILQQYPEYLPALDNLATNYFILNKSLANASVLAKRAFLLAPTDPFIINLRAQAYIFEKENEQAIKILTPVLTSFHNSGLGYYSLAKAYAGINNKQQAKNNLTRALNKQLPDMVRKSAIKLSSTL